MADATYQPKVYEKQGGDTLVVASGGKIEVESGGEIEYQSGAVQDGQDGAQFIAPFIEKAASFNVLAAESGAVYLLKAVDIKATLPATAAGLKYTFIVHTVSAVTGAQIDPAAADAIHGNGLTSVDDKDLVNTAATDAEGDSVTIVGDGADGWWIESINGTWAKEA